MVRLGLARTQRIRWGIPLVAIVIVACASPAAPPPATVASSPASATASQQGTLPTALSQPVDLPILVDNISIGTSRLWAMNDAGIFQRHGLNTRVDFAEGTAATQAMIAGQYNAGNVSASGVIASDAQEPSLKIVAVINSTLQYALVGAKGITSADDLRGKSLGIAKLGDSSDTATRLILQKLGLDPDKDVTYLQVGNSPQRFAALQTGNIQGMIADPMDIVRAKREGFPVIADLPSLSIPYAGNAFALRTDFIQAHRDQALQFVLAVVDGVHYYKTHQQEVTSIAAAHLESDDTDAIRSAVGVFANTIMAEKPYATRDNLQSIIDEVATTNTAVQGEDFSRFVDNSLLDEIDKSGYIDALYASGS